MLSKQESEHAHEKELDPRFSRLHWVVLIGGLILGLGLIAASLGIGLGLKSLTGSILLGGWGLFTTAMTPYGFIQLRWMYEQKPVTGWRKMLTGWYGVFGFINAILITFFSYVFYIMWMQIFGVYKYIGRYGWVFEFETTPGWVHSKFWSQKWGGSNTGALCVYNHEWENYSEQGREDLKDHERRHAWQMFVFGIWGVCIYGTHSLILRIQGKDGYRDVILEVGARRAEIQDM